MKQQYYKKQSGINFNIIYAINFLSLKAAIQQNEPKLIFIGKPYQKQQFYTSINLERKSIKIKTKTTPKN